MKTLRVEDVAKKTGISKAVVWAWSRTGEYNFPKPFALSPKITVWDEADIDKWLLTRKHPELLEVADETQ